MTSPTPSPTRFNVTRSSPSLWRVTFHNPPINLIDPVMIVELHTLLTQIEQDNQVAVVVFDSADPDFFLAHYDIAADPSARDRRSRAGVRDPVRWRGLRRGAGRAVWIRQPRRSRRGVRRVCRCL